MQLLGAGEILLTSMDRDGTRNGFDLALTRAISDAVDVPVIASGGVGNLHHLVEGVLQAMLMRYWQRAFSTTVNIPYARPKDIWRSTASKYGCSGRMGLLSSDSESRHGSR